MTRTEQRQRAGRGRQLEARRNDQSLMDAARLVFAIHGPDAPVSAVAAAAGVGIASLYRRYATKEELLQHLCQVSMDQQIGAAELVLGLGDNPWPTLTRYIRLCVMFRAGVFGSIAGTIPVTGEMIATAQRANQLVTKLVDRARRSGTLRQDINSVDIFELVALFSRRPATDDPDTIDPATTRLLEIAIDGLRQQGHGRISVPTITWEQKARQWAYPGPDAPPSVNLTGNEPE